MMLEFHLYSFSWKLWLGLSTTWAHSTLGIAMRFSCNVDGCWRTFLKPKQLAQLYTIIIELHYPYSTATTHASKFRCWCYYLIEVEMANNSGLVHVSHAGYCRKTCNIDWVEQRHCDHWVLQLYKHKSAVFYFTSQQHFRSFVCVRQ